MITLHTIIYGDWYKKIGWFETFRHPLITERIATITNVDESFENRPTTYYYQYGNFSSLYFDPYLSLFNLNTKYVLHVAPDCMGQIHIEDSFFTDSVAELENDRCISTMINWHPARPGQGEEDSSNRILGRLDTSDKFFRRVNFTDQFFMAKLDTLRKIDYTVPSDISRKIYGGPPYGVDSFEERLTGYQIVYNKFNSIHKGDSYYVHRS